MGFATVASLIALGMNVDVKLPSPAASASVAAAPPPPPIREEPAKTVAKRVRQKIPGPFRLADARSDPSTRLVEGKVGKEAFLKALEKAGVPLREAYRILTSMKGVREFDRCKPRDQFLVLLDRASNRVSGFEYVVSAEEVYQSRAGSDGLLKGQKLDLKVERRQVSGALVHDGKSFETSAQQSGFDSGLSRVVAKALDGHLGMDEFERGARVRVIAQEITVLGEFARYAGVEAIEARTPSPEKKPLRVYYLDAAGERGYYDADGRAPYEGGWRKPIAEAPITSPYNLKRLHPILKKVHPHLGIDFGAPTGTPVGAASYGTVTVAAYVGATGNLVKVEHPGNIETGYAHLSRFAEGLKVGDKVKRLQVIGYVGSTGRSTGPHLHFSARKNGEFIDPATLRLDAMRTVSKDARAVFAEVKAKYDLLLEAIPLPEPLAAEVDAGASGAQPAASSIAIPRSESLDQVGSAEEEDDEDTGTPAAPAGSAPAPAKKPPGSSIYLTDKELLELQGATDEGEVSE
jgi:murein DD-endopeptidase MepM/ murein hydrolase activator NlpD